MPFEYKRIETGHFDCKVVFYGQENVPPNYVYSGNNVRECFVLHLVLEGKGNFASAGRNMVQLQAGDAFLLPQAIPCFYQADGQEPWTYLWIGLAGQTVKEIFGQSQFQEKYYIRNVQASDFGAHLTALFTSVHQPQNYANQLQVESALYATLAALIRDYPGQRQHHAQNSFQQFKAAERMMYENVANGYKVGDVCAALHLSRGYVYQLFKTYAAQSPQTFLLDLRIKKAKELLRQTNHSLQSISSMVGYKDPFTLSKAFKRHTGQTPSAYRDEHLR